MTNKKMPAGAKAQMADTRNNLDKYNAKAHLLSILYEGKKSRQELVRRMGISDREVRDIIAELRDEGQPICSTSSSCGYWLGNSTQTKRTIAEYRARGIKCLATAAAMELRMQEEGQMEVGDVLV